MFHIELDNSVAFAIRGSKPWPCIRWFGKQTEELGLAVYNNSSHTPRCMELSSSDGSISKHHPLVDKFISDSSLISSSKDGKLFLRTKRA